MTTGIKASEERFNAIVNRRKELEADYTRIYDELREAEDASAERILEGASIEAETKKITERRLQREQVAAALELSRARETAAQEAFRQKRLEDAWSQARKIWIRNFKAIDRITVAASKLITEREALHSATNELNRLGGQFVTTEGANLFMPEGRILQQAAYTLDVLGKQLERLEATRANYDRNYSAERTTGNLGEG